MMHPAILDARAVARHVETLLPPIQTVDAALLTAGANLGPEVTVPAVYLHIIIAAFEAEALATERKGMEATIAAVGRKPKSAMDDEQISAGAVHLATEADAITSDPTEAAMCLWKAAATIAVVHFPPENALSALDGIHAMTRADVAQAIGMGVTKQ